MLLIVLHGIALSDAFNLQTCHCRLYLHLGLTTGVPVFRVFILRHVTIVGSKRATSVNPDTWIVTCGLLPVESIVVMLQCYWTYRCTTGVLLPKDATFQPAAELYMVPPIVLSFKQRHFLREWFGVSKSLANICRFVYSSCFLGTFCVCRSRIIFNTIGTLY